MTLTNQPRLGPIALAVPDHSIDQQQGHDILARCASLDGDDLRLSQAVHLRSGIQRRGSVLLGADPFKEPSILDRAYPSPTSTDDRGPTTAARMRRFDQHAAPLAVHAARDAMRGTRPEAVTHVITVSCTGMTAPGVDLAIMNSLGLPPTAHRANLGFMGCHGGVIALRTANDVARAAIARGEHAVVLVVCVELCTLHMPYRPRRDQVVAAALFADGAAAVLVSTCLDRGIAVQSASSRLIPDTAELMRWDVGDHGFEMTLGERVPEVVAAHATEAVETAISAAKMPIDRCRLRYAIHPGGPRVLSAVAAALRLDQDATHASRCVLRDHGNMSSVTTLAIAAELLRMQPVDPVVILGVGPGLTLESVVLA